MLHFDLHYQLCGDFEKFGIITISLKDQWQHIKNAVLWFPSKLNTDLTEYRNMILNKYLFTLDLKQIKIP